MLDEYGFEEYEKNEFPLAYLITIRTFGTWLHGDERHSVDRHGRNIYGTPDIPPNEKLEEIMKSELKQPPVVLNDSQRKATESAIRELCEQRKYFLRAINVRSNHAHAVVSAQAKPERIADAFKAFATKKLREENLCNRDLRIWSRGRSRRYLWKPRHVAKAIDYVLYGQGDAPFDPEVSKDALLKTHLLRACFRNPTAEPSLRCRSTHAVSAIFCAWAVFYA